TAYWSMDGSGVDTVAGRNLTLHGQAAYVASPSLSGSSLSAGGTANFADVADTDFGNFANNDFTLQTWVNFPTFNADNTLLLMDKSESLGLPGFRFYADYFGATTHKISFTFYTSVASAPQTAISVSTPQIDASQLINSWHQIIAARSGQ